MANTPKPVRQAIKKIVKKSDKIRLSKPEYVEHTSEKHKKQRPKTHAKELKVHLKLGGSVGRPGAKKSGYTPLKIQK